MKLPVRFIDLIYSNSHLRNSIFLIGDLPGRKPFWFLCRKRSNTLKSSADSASVFQTSAGALSGPGVLLFFNDFRHALSSSSVKSSVLIGSSVDLWCSLSHGNLWWFAKKVGKMFFLHLYSFRFVVYL